MQRKQDKKYDRKRNKDSFVEETRLKITVERKRIRLFCRRKQDKKYNRKRIKIVCRRNKFKNTVKRK